MEPVVAFNFEEVAKITEEERSEAVLALEEGSVVFLPQLGFPILDGEYGFFTPDIIHPSAKNISYTLATHTLGKNACQENETPKLRALLHRYATESKALVDALFPHYTSTIRQGRTSFRPAEASGRKLSYKKDDTLLHVDAFPASPVQGMRILRVFTNVNPYGKPRIWKVGEPFAKVVEKMAPRLKPPFSATAPLLNFLKITKTERSLYDHYMLKLHDGMKADRHYQQTASQKEIHFPPQSTWIVFSDQVSHAALAGQFLFEQTYYLPVQGQKYPEKSPLRLLERYFQKPLVVAASPHRD